MNKETLNQRLAELKKQGEQMTANYNALLGRIAEVELLIKTLNDKEKAEAAMAEAVVVDAQPEGYAE